MSTAELINRIKVLPPEELAIVKAHLGSKVSTRAKMVRPRRLDPLLDRITARRERILAQSGPLPDSAPTIREWRDGIE